MSYLLDALKKAQLERESLQSQTLPIEQHALKSQTMPAWLIVVIVVFIGISIFQVLPNKTQQKIAPAERESAVIVPKQSEMEIQKFIAEAPANVASQPVQANETLQETSIAPLELTELPAHILRKIPSLSLQSHIYSPDPTYRSVIINDQTFRENMFIEDQVILSEITSQGVNIKVADYLIFLPKGISWVATNRAE